MRQETLLRLGATKPLRGARIVLLRLEVRTRRKIMVTGNKNLREVIRV